MSLGTGYEYLLRSVARGDGAAPASTPLTRYYAESGTPPGRFLGAGLPGLNDGYGVAAGTEVTEEHLFRLLGMMADPVTGRPLGRLPQHSPAPLRERIRLRVDALGADLSPADRSARVALIEAEEKVRERRISRPVAGFDLTFSVAKSVSVVWALADASTQATIYRAHQDAIGIAIGYAEKHMLFSRSGAGGVVQEGIRGVVAVAFDHWDSRAGDPHLHTHVVVANRTQCLDGTWRSLDSRSLHRYVVALSELHEGVLQDLLSNRLGYAWEERARRHSPVPRWEIAGVSEELIAEFSRRSTDIDTATDALIADYARTHGRHPSGAELLRLRQQATLATRPDKQQHTLAEQTWSWRERARPFLAGDAAGWAERPRGRCVLPALGADVDPGLLSHAAGLALGAVSAKRATFSHGNVLAEVHRQLHGARFATPDYRLAVANRMTHAALEQALLLTAPGHVSESARIYTTREVLDAETRLLDAGRDLDGPAVAADIVADVIADPVDGDPPLGADQAAAVSAIATSGRVLDLLVGPAGTGKTTSLAALRDTWEDEHGLGSVIGLAPSAAAAQVLADELEIDTDNTAKWLFEQDRQPDRAARIEEIRERIRTQTSNRSTALARRLHADLDATRDEYEQWNLQAGDLVIIDEAGLAGTLALDRILTQARDAGAKILLVGDPAQLASADAGGAFAMLAHDRTDAARLDTVHRFHHQWERDASTLLRAGDPAAIKPYTAHDRIESGHHADMLDAIYEAWRHDTTNGLTSLMIAADTKSVAELNQRAQADRIASGQVQPRLTPIADGTAGVGDRVLTRHNDRRLRDHQGWVKNGDTWTVQAIGDDGSLTVRRDNGTPLTLPRDYVREHVELGYATTVFRAQGRTVDTAHALIPNSSTREVLYVAATRGRDANHIYLDTSGDPDPDTRHHRRHPESADEVLRRILNNTGADTSAHTILERELQRAPVTQQQPAATSITHHGIDMFPRQPWQDPQSVGVELRR